VKEKDGFLQIEVEDGEKFLPRLFNELTVEIDSIELRKPTLDDVFLSLTGRAIREEEPSDKERMRQRMRTRRRN
jgi:ABC-2 type transport system ATP-binding protein